MNYIGLYIVTNIDMGPWLVMQFIFLSQPVTSNRGHVDAVEMIMTEYLSFTVNQNNYMNRCKFTIIIPVRLSEDQDWSQLTGRLRVGPVSCILQLQGLSLQFLKWNTLVDISRPTLTWGHGQSCIYCLSRLWSWPCRQSRNGYDGVLIIHEQSNWLHG